MSKLDDLINKLCPDGVNFEPLWKNTIWDKHFNSVEKEKQKNVISYPYLLANELFPLKREKGNVFLLSTGAETGWTTEELAADNLCEGEVVTIPWGKSRPLCEVMKYYKGKFVTADNRIATSNDIEKLSNKFLFYVLISKSGEIDSFYRGSSLQHPNMAKVLNLEIPVPPLEIQNEIVRILDNFTELEEELEEELVARRKQYEYYRDSLLSFDDSVEWKKLGDIATDIYRGSGIKRDQVTPDGIPCVRYGEIYTTYNIHFDTCVSHTVLEEIQSPKYFEHGDILFAITGESIEDIAKSIAYMGNDKCLAGGDTVVLKHKQNPKYLAFALSTTNAIMQKGKGKVKSKVVHSSVPSISEIEVPIPSLEEQERIANILDNFLQLCNNLTSGLPAEIEARHKQYEYYRDKLLTFKRRDEK